MRLVAFALILSSALTAQRPAITGIARVGLFVSDLAKSESFYGRELGLLHFGNSYRVNAFQAIDLYPGLQGDGQDRLSYIAFATSDANQLRIYLAGKGVPVPGRLTQEPRGDLSFRVNDPEGRQIEFVEVRSEFAGSVSPTAVSQHILHAGFIVHDREAEDRFYRDLLGFEVMWYGGKTDTGVDWVDMRVPDGGDWLEYMLGSHNPSPKSRGVLNHFALGVKDIHAVHLEEPHEAPKIGRDGKWQLNLYDPDLTRAELMELAPVEKPCCSLMHAK